MTCDEYWELLSAQTDSELTGSEEQALREHLAGCRSCQAAGAQLAALRAAFDDLEEAPAPEGFARGVMDQIRAEKPRRTISLFKRPQLRALAGLAACVAAVLCLYRGELVRQDQARWTAVEEDFSTDALTEDTGGGEALAQERSMADPERKESPGPAEVPQLSAYAASGCAADGLDGAAAPAPDAVIAFERLPEGWEELFPGVASPDAMQVPAEEARAFLRLLEEQGIASEISGSLDELDENSLCQLLLAEG